MRREGLIQSEEVFRAFLSVDRADFLPLQFRDRTAYEDKPFRESVNGTLYHLSAPHIYATVLEALDLSEGLSFLNMGSGTGYLSHLVARIVGPRRANHGVEIQSELVEWAQSRSASSKNLSDLNFIKFRLGDVFRFDASAPKYDRIYIGGAVDFQTVTKLRSLLNINGILVAPRDEELVAMQRGEDEIFSTRVISAVNFGPLVEPQARLSKLLPPFRIDDSYPVDVATASPRFGVTQARFVKC